jgi:hypothetical protein
MVAIAAGPGLRQWWQLQWLRCGHASLKNDRNWAQNNHKEEMNGPANEKIFRLSRKRLPSLIHTEARLDNNPKSPLVVSTCFMSLTKMLGTRSVSEFRFS